MRWFGRLGRALPWAALALAGPACGDPKTSHDAAIAAAPLSSTEPKPKLGSHPAPERQVPIDDRSGRLTAEQRGALLAKLESHANDNLAALIVPTLSGETVEQLADRTFKSWQLGDNGILVVIAIQEKQSRIETGRGIGGIITDDQTHQILLDHLNPHLRQGDFYGGLDETFDAVVALLSVQKWQIKCERMLEDPSAPNKPRYYVCREAVP